ncbi:MAG: hypothetical protein ACT4N8_05790 [Sphingosinicella sp.]|uniref:hypothetical protein n=1 Tax=Sphingosinicella sp. TaxID=1917971 RepID=UPI00403791F0
MSGNDTETESRRAPRPRHDGFSAERKRLFLVALRRGDSVITASALVGISTRTAYRHRDRDPEFARDWDLARGISNMPLELAAFERGVAGIEEPVYAYGKLSHTRRRLSDSALLKLLAAEQPEKYGRAAGLAPLLARLERKIDKQVAADVAELGESLRGEVAYFMTGLADAFAARLSEGKGGAGGGDPPLAGPKISPNPLQP